MKIAFFADNFYPELSGIVDSVLITGKELTKRGHDVIYVGPHYAGGDYTLVGKQCFKKDGVEMVDDMQIIRLPSLPLPFSPTGQSRFAFPSGIAVKVLQDWKPDVIHTHSPYGVGFEAKKAAKKLGVPLVGTNHTPIEEFYPFAPTLMRKFDAWYYNHCEYVTTPFEKLLVRMREKGFNKPGSALPNPVVHSLFNPASAEEKITIKKRFGFEGPVLLYAGRVAPEKHIDVIIKSVKELLRLTESFSMTPEKVPYMVSKIMLVVTGHGSALSSLKKLVAELSLEKHVLFTGFISKEDLALYYKAADVFVIMSTADSQSIALMQAYATGIPAIGANAHGLPDYIKPGWGLVVAPGDISALTSSIQELLGSDTLREKMGKTGAHFVETLSPLKIADEWEKIYQNIITQSTNIKASP